MTQLGPKGDMIPILLIACGELEKKNIKSVHSPMYNHKLMNELRKSH